MLIGLAFGTHAVMKGKYKKHIQDFPTRQFSLCDKAFMIEQVEYYLCTNNTNMRSDTRKEMLAHPISQLGKYVLETVPGGQAIFDTKIYGRKGKRIEDMNTFKTKLSLTLEKVSCAY